LGHVIFYVEKTWGGMFMIKRLFPICLSVIILVGLSSLSYAECAWVLWIQKEYLIVKEPPEQRVYWEINNAVPTHKECKELQRQLWERMDKHYKNLPHTGKVDSTPFIIIVKTGEATLTESFYCLPDTIDPRKK
jgi:hypothetical protein